MQPTALAALLLLSSLIFLWISISAESKNVGFDSEAAYIMEGEWQVSAPDGQRTMTLPAKIDSQAGVPITLTRILDTDSCKGNSVMFYTRQTWVQIFLDGELIQSSDEDRVTPFAMTPGSYWHFFRIPDDFAGKTLTIELKPTLQKYAGELPTVYVGTKASFLYMIVSNARFSLIVTGAVLLIGISMLVFGLVAIRFRMADRLVRMGLFAMAYSIWMILESRITQVFAGDMVVASYLLFACFYMLPVLACSFLLTYESLAESRSTHVLFWISVLSVVVVHILQVAGVAYYINLVAVVHILLILIILNTLVVYLRNRCAGKSLQDVSIYKAMLFLGVCCILDVLQFYVIPRVQVGNFSKVGILLFFGYLGYVGIRNFGRIEIQEAENRVYKKLAYSDMMTGMANRTAFERVLAEYRNAPWQEETILLVADMNRLKYVNDTFGHAAGDEALKQIGQLMMQQFTQGCQCFRTGGDEYCVISRGVPYAEFAKLCDTFTKKVSEICLTQGVHLSVSCGFCTVDAAGIDECYKKADALMYESKVASKMQRDMQ